MPVFREKALQWAALGAAIGVCLTMSIVPKVAEAATPSASDGNTDPEQGEGGLRVDDRLHIPLESTPGWTNNIWLWRGGRRAFTIAKPKPLNSNTTRDLDLNTTIVTAYDLDTGAEVARASLERSFATDRTYANNQSLSKARFAAVDEITGRVFIPHAQVFTRNVDAPTMHTSALQDGGSCLTVQGHAVGTSDPTCLVGLYVLDGTSLRTIKRIPFGGLSVDGGFLLAPQLVAMSYSLPSGQVGGKVHLLVREAETKRMGDAQFTVNYAVQVDPDAGRVDWVQRIDGCRGARQPQTLAEGETGANNSAAPYRRRTNEAVIFAGGPAGTRSVWMGCHMPNQTATIARIPLDGAGFPARLPYEPGDPGDMAEAFADGPPTSHRPEAVKASSTPAQQAFPGPKNTWEFVADPASERILLKVVDGSPIAEVWWVFDGRVGAFIGTIGIGRYNPLQTVSGLDPSSGRFYVLAPPQPNSAGFSGERGGLFLVDARRSPVPQALVFEGLGSLLNSGPAARNVSPIEVDYGDGSEIGRAHV
jgi:hypothetical protein